MRTETRRFRVPAGTQEVWQFLADYCNDLQWRPELRDCRLVSGAAGTAGALYHGQVAWEGLSAEFDVECIDALPYENLAYRSLVEHARTQAAYHLEPDRQKTLVTVTFTLDMRGPFLMLEPFAWGILTRWARAAEDALPEALGRLHA